MNPGKDFHIFNIFGDTLLSLPSGEVYVLDGIAADLVYFNPENVEEAQAILQDKYDKKAIIKAFDEMEKVFSKRIKDHSKDNPPRNLRALCLNITHKCNLACSYCFAEKLTEGAAKTMTKEVVQASLDFLFKESKENSFLQVDFFGGEPLLAFNMVMESVRYARYLESKYEKKVLFTLTTNATLITQEIIDFIKSNNINLILSLDGRKEINNLYRKFRDGTGTYNIIINNIRKIKESFNPDDYYIRGTFTSGTIEILDTLQFYLDEGFYNVSLEPVLSGKDTPYSIGEDCVEILRDKYRKIARWLLDKPMKFFHFNLEMDNPLCLTRRITGCGAGVEYMAIDPDGLIYPCHQFIEIEEFRLGNVFGGIERKEFSCLFREATIYTKEECTRCWARFYCGGGCHFQHFLAGGKIHHLSKLYCKIFQLRLESALWYNIMRRNYLSSEQSNKS